MFGLGFGILKSSKLEKNADGDQPVYVCKTELAKNDLQSLENEHHTGSQARPPAESKVAYGWWNVAWKWILAVNDNVPKVTLNEGERIDYASDSGAIVCSIFYKKGGGIEIHAPSDLTIKAGDLIVENDILCDGDVFALASSTPKSLATHPHIDNWGKPTSEPQTVAAPPPTVPATIIVESNFDLSTNNKNIDGVIVDQHGHPYTWTDPAGSGVTDPPQ